MGKYCTRRLGGHLGIAVVQSPLRHRLKDVVLDLHLCDMVKSTNVYLRGKLIAHMMDKQKAKTNYCGETPEDLLDNDLSCFCFGPSNTCLTYRCLLTKP